MYPTPFLLRRGAWLLLQAAGPALAAPALPDEIQVYTDDINRPGAWGLELHVNTTPKGTPLPEFPGAVPSNHGSRATPELSYGLTNDFEAGLYLPSVMDASGNLYLPGVKARLKWVPVHSESSGGWYLGANGEIARISEKFSQSALASELRLMAGYRNDAWLVCVNPVFSWQLSPGQRENNPQFEHSWKVSRTVAAGMALGMEYYSATGRLGQALPKDQQDRSAFLVMDFDRKPWVFNLGLGKGLTDAADPWTIKAIFEIPFD